MVYIKRIVDTELRDRLSSAGAVLITGAKGTGKTESARQLSRSEVRIDVDLDVSELMGIDPFMLLEGEKPRLLDEWQLQPRLWDYVRRAVDDSKKRGQFILTGSSQPVKDVRSHSGAGRFSVIRMRPLSWQELGLSSGEVRLAEVLENQLNATHAVDMSLDEIIIALSRGGWPATLADSDRDAAQYVQDYVTLLAEVDVKETTDARIDAGRVKRFLQSFARNIATEAGISTVIKDMQGEYGEALAPDTITRYIEALESLMIIENLPALKTHIRSSATLRKASKKHFVDPSIAVAALGHSPEMLKKDLNYFGLLFESLALRDLRIYAQALGAAVFHYRDSSGLEVDAIVQQTNGAMAAFEVKLGRSEHDGAAQNLQKLASLVNGTRSQPLVQSLNIITGFGFAYTRPDGVNVIPLNVLGV